MNYHMKSISEFDDISHLEVTLASSKGVRTPREIERVDSLEGLMSQNSLDSFRKFRDTLIERLQHSADKDLSISIECPSNTSEIFSVYKGLESDSKSWNLELMTDKKGNPMDFVDLFLHRYKQVCKDRQRVRESDLKQFTRVLENNTIKQRKKPADITNFDVILKL